jgi:hypothetical protein
MWIYLAIIGMGLGAGYWVGYPLLRPRKFDSPSEPTSEDSLRDLNIKKEEIYSAIKEMEFDHKMGKLSQEDYLNLKEKYKTRAIGSLKRMDELEGKKDFSRYIEDEIEKEVLAIRRDGPKGTSKKGEDVFCTQCGKRRTPGDRFCSSCGTKLAKP